MFSDGNEARHSACILFQLDSRDDGCHTSLSTRWKKLEGVANRSYRSYRLATPPTMTLIEARGEVWL